jgi:S1-C subfamily serine protease
MNANLKASLGVYVIERTFPFAHLWAGSAVCVWMDTRALHTYIATAGHVVAGDDYSKTYADITLILVDANNKKYVNPEIIILDRSYDFCLLRVPGTSSFTMANPDRTDAFETGDPCYAIGFPLTLDANSVSSGVIRSRRWTSTGTLENVLISAPILPGNSGGGVFTSKDNNLIGIVSWVYVPPGFSPIWTFAGVVSAFIVREALYLLMYSSIVEYPIRSYAKQYFLGIHGRQLVSLRDVHVYQSGGALTHPALQGKAVMGFKIDYVQEGSPAGIAGLVSYKRVNAFETYDIIWAVSFDNSDWEVITEENPLSRILHEHLRDPNRLWIPHRAISLKDKSLSERNLLIKTFDTKFPQGPVLLYLLVTRVTQSTAQFETVVTLRIDGFNRIDFDVTYTDEDGIERLYQYVDNRTAWGLPHGLTTVFTGTDNGPGPAS